MASVSCKKCHIQPSPKVCLVARATLLAVVVVHRDASGKCHIC